MYILRSLLHSQAGLASKRVANILSALTYMTYRHINRGLYEHDKLLFVFIITMKILVTRRVLAASSRQLFLQACWTYKALQYTLLIKLYSILLYHRPY